MIHVALIGAGGHSLSCHAPALAQAARENSGGLKLEAICDLDLAKARQAASEFGFARACGSIDELLDEGSRVDALIAVLPIPAMISVTPLLLRRGLPLLIEKPLGRDVREARTICKAVTEQGATDRVMVSFNRRFDPALTAGLAWARRQGPIRYVRATMMRSLRTETDFVWGTGIHLIDALCHIAGPLSCVARSGHHSDAWRVAELRGREGTTVWLEILPTSGRAQEQIHLMGDEYHVEIHTGAVPPWKVLAHLRGELVLDATVALGEPLHVSNGTYQETRAFLDAVEQRRSLFPGVTEALASSELAARLQALNRPSAI